MNRKLIRTTLAEVKGRGNETHHREGGEMVRRAGPPPGRSGGSGGPSREGSGGDRDRSPSASAAALGRKKIPPAETNAEIFYYKKQMDAHTLMVIVLQDGEEIEGTIEWYDRNALKINRKDEPNLMLLKHNIKYMYKFEERDGEDEDDDGEGEEDDE